MRRLKLCSRLDYIVMLLLTGAAGCFQSPPVNPPPTSTQSAAAGPQSNPGAPGSPSEILKRLLKTYRQAATYQDEAVVRLEFTQGGQQAGDRWPSAVRFVRPNKLSLAAFQATVKCDGQELKAQIEDKPTANIDGQVLIRPAPPALKLSDLASDQLLYDIVCGEIRRQPIQLELLLESGGLAAAIESNVACQKLEDGEAGGRDCFRIEVPSPGGSFVFWIDKGDWLLRRLDYPAAALLPGLANDPSITDLRLSAELIGAKIGQPIADEQFALAVPANAKRMRSLVLPPQPLPSQLFGKEPGTFQFTELGGGKLQSDKLAGKIAVLVWYHDNPACEATLQQVSAARERLKDDENLAFYAVATDPTSLSNQQLEERLNSWKVDLPIVRDLDALGDKVFKIEVQPTLVVLDPQLRVQIFQPGGNPQLADQIVQIAERLKAGTDLAAEIVAQNERERKQYDELVARGGPEPGQVFELPEAVIRARSEPKILKLKELWTCKDLKSQGNLLVVEESNAKARIYVVEGWRTVTEIDEQGRVVGRHVLDLPERAAITYVRTATDKSGRRLFVAAAPLSPQLFVFDSDWRLVRSFPEADQAPLAVTDVAFADVNDGDGTPEILAANVNDVGLVALGIDGQTAWRNRAQPNATSVVVSRPSDTGSWGIFVTGDAGTVLRVNRFGHEEPPLAVGKWPIARLIAARFPAGTQAKFLGLSNNERGELFAVGITDAMKEAWTYPLPPGVHQRPIDAVASSDLLPGRQGEWWLAGPDGSIHVISEDGELHDAFNYGAALNGIAAAKLGEQAVLLVATEEGVAAWKID